MKTTGSRVSETEGYNAEAFSTEAYGTYGLKGVYYKVHEDLKRDKIYGEDQLMYIERAFNFMLYTESIPPNVRTYQLQGIWGEDVLTCYVGITAFKYWSTYGNPDRNTPLIYDDFIPKIGDVVYLEANDTFYEIRDVKFYQEAFGLTSHTYTLTLRVYKGSKLTIDTMDPTLSDKSDPIYKVATSGWSEQYEMNDVLKNNDILEGENLYNSDNVNHMDVLYNPELHDRDRYGVFQDELNVAIGEINDALDGFNLDTDDLEQHIGKTVTSAANLFDETSEVESEIEEIKNNSTEYEWDD